MSRYFLYFFIVQETWNNTAEKTELYILQKSSEMLRDGNVQHNFIDMQHVN